MVGNNLDKLLEKLGIAFNDQQLLQQAFIHRSYLNEARQAVQSNERLEFLGDAVLSFVVSSVLFNKRLHDTEGDLTNLRSYIVKTKSLAEAAERINLGYYLQMSRGEDATGGRKNPQLLANTYEALLGAVYLDQGFVIAQQFVEATLLPLFAKEIESGPPKDAKSELQEVVQEQVKESPLYRILSTKGPDHAKEFTVGVFIKGKEYGRGTGLSKQVAEEKAAEQALKQFT